MIFLGLHSSLENVDTYDYYDAFCFGNGDFLYDEELHSLNIELYRNIDCKVTLDKG